MKSFRLAVFFSIVFLLASCSVEQTATSDNNVKSGKPVLLLSPTVDGSQTAANYNNGTPPHETFARHGSDDVTAALASLVTSPARPQRTSDSATSLEGRENPFALAEELEFEVRFFAAKGPAAAQALLPVPDVGLGPEESGGALLLPLGVTPAVSQLPIVTLPAPAVIQPLALASPLPEQLPPGLPADGLPLSSPVATGEDAVSASPTALAEAVEIKGILQLGGHSAIIVKDSKNALSRTVYPGARLAGGEVELRRIDITAEEPQVVLVQNGIEIMREVGI